MAATNLPVNGKKRKSTLGKDQPAVAIVVFVIFVLYTVLLLLMFVWALINSLKANDVFALNCVTPVGATHFENYINAFNGIKMIATIGGVEYYITMPEMFLNSVIYAVGTAFFATVTPMLVAYVTAKYRNKFNHVIYGIVLFAMITPIVGNLPSQIQVAKALGLFNNHFGQWFLSMTFLGTYYLIFYSIFKGVSWGYAESAFIDGAGHFTVLFRIMLPLVSNTFLVVFVLNFIGQWNNYQTPLIFLPSYPTVAVGIQYFRDNPIGGAQFRGVPMQLAGGIMVMLPVIVLFTALGNKLVGNLTMGGMKE